MLRIVRDHSVVVLFLFMLAVPSARGQSSQGSLKVTSFPSGAHVSVDGADTGKVTPMNVSLTVGDHVVLVSIPGGGWSPDSRTVTVVFATTGSAVPSLTVIFTGWTPTAYW